MSGLTDRIAYKLWECDVKGVIGIGGDWTPVSEEVKDEYRTKARAVEAALELTEERGWFKTIGGVGGEWRHAIVGWIAIEESK